MVDRPMHRQLLSPSGLQSEDEEEAVMVQEEAGCKQ